MKTAAFFDLDKTILGTTSSLAFTRPLYEQGMLKRADVVRSAYQQFLFSTGAADHAQMERMREYLSALVTGWDVEQLTNIVLETLNDRITPTVHLEALELIASHRAAGRDVIIVSASGSEIVHPVAELLGATDAIARGRISAAGPDLLKLLEDPDEGLRLAACQASAILFRELPRTELISTMVRRMELDPSSQVRNTAGLVLVALGFFMAFRQAGVRRMFGWTAAPREAGSADPVTYALRIAGVMIMVFGFVLGMMVTLFSLT